jgi:uncharacterized RDD family membrane protein YckC
MHTAGRSGFWIRAAAAAIDGVIFLVFAATIAVTVAVLEARGTLTEPKERIFNAMLVALWLAYTSMEATIGATAGKLACGIVITLPDAAPAPPWTRFLRWSTKQFGIVMILIWLLTAQPLFYFLGGVVNGMLVVGMLLALGEERRTWLDLWTHTAVVSRRRAAEMRAVHEEPVGAPGPT